MQCNAHLSRIGCTLTSTLSMLPAKLIQRLFLLFVFLLLAFLFSGQANAIVIRHDMPSDQYIVNTPPPYLVNMPGEGHGSLIHPQWIVTVGHLIFSNYAGKTVNINGQPYTIEKVIVHPGVAKPASSLFSHDAAPLMHFLKTTDDVALLKLTKPVSNAEPLLLYRQDKEQGKTIQAFGRGSTGDGINGSVFETKRAKILRTLHNTVELVDGNWISITFDRPNNHHSTSSKWKKSADMPANRAHEMEGIDGSGDSGGPLVWHQDGKTYLMGMFSWDYVEGDLRQFKHGLYGSRSYQVRISRYAEWIDAQIQQH